MTAVEERPVEVAPRAPATVGTPSKAMLTKLAVCYAEAGFPATKEGRARRLAHASAAVGRTLASSAELTRQECHRLIEDLELAVACSPIGSEPRYPVQPDPPGGDEVPPGGASGADEATGGAPSAVADPTDPGPGRIPHPDADVPRGASHPAGTLVGIARGPYGCGPEGKHWVLVDAEEVTHCACGSVSHVPNKGSCAPNRCYCGHCPSWHPRPEINYRRAIAELREKEQLKLERRTRPGAYRGRRR